MFEGYTQETFEFFMAIQFNNNRDFFHANHDWYTNSVREPSLRLVEALAPVIEEIDPNLERRGYKVLSHINRDIRFSNNKAPYRDYLWLSFHQVCEEHPKLIGFYFDLGTEGSSFGMGSYRENRDMTRALRHQLETAPEEFLEVLRPALAEFTLVGTPDARKKVPDSVPEALRDIYRMRTFYFEQTIRDFSLIKSPALADKIIRGYRQLKPLYSYLIRLTESETEN